MPRRRPKHTILIFIGFAIICWLFISNILYYVSYASSSDDNDNKSMILLGAGKGTTGTHVMFQATCLLGIPSHHWEVGCINDNNSWISSYFFKSYYSDSVRKHLQLKNLVYDAATCVHSQSTKKCGGAIEWKEKVMGLLQDIILDGRFIALHDTPYSMLMPQLYDASKRYYHNVIIINTERDPKQYVTRRISKPYGAVDMFCKDISRQINSSTLVGGRFDVVSCIDRAIASQRQRQQVDDATTKIDLVDVFTSIRNLIDETEHGWNDVVTVKHYQDVVRSISNFSIDLFQRSESYTTKEELALMLKGSIPLIQQQQKSSTSAATIVDWLNWKRIDYDEIP